MDKLILLLSILQIIVVHISSLEYGDHVTGCFHSDSISKDIKNPLQCCTQSLRCECDSGLYFNEAQNRCVSPPNGLCTSYSRDGFPIRTCTEFATCWPNEKHDPALPRQNGTCYCEPDAKEDPITGLCKLTFGSTRCTKLNDCDVHSLISCRYGRCGCQDEEYQKYNESSHRCESLAGGACGVKNKKLPFPAAECHGPNMACEGGKCVCEEGYGKTHDKMCIKLTARTHICQESNYRFASFGGPTAYAKGGLPGGGVADNNEQVGDVADGVPAVPSLGLLGVTQSEPTE